MNGAELAGRLIGFVIFLAVPIVMIVVGQRRKRESGGQRGGVLFVSGIVLLVLVVLGILGSAGQMSTAP
ncbi:MULTISPECIES: hypothetical protein [unclassified Aeromicrobium]|jgi:NADH:ubiquinone oxidoreductase subunit 6 (subunit J)|uniref:hypothetical protein n=1 Tax=unclassified Aeromicrobium TaxID=2633570 RepID=UPI002096AE13|nr:MULTISPECIES: hypothetical protein [unclassified Aeromicrobium]MCO7238030.1 hypothetical protein [Aeromicrobium sp. CnD17-E]MDR6119403.1 NADH:ubiquinone oxidoreductase subunit 6 (subunit J) [Aeromicrobium sp. SORGH_AS_0981]